MLTHSPRRHGVRRTRERGVILMVALIVLVALTLAGIALMRSVDTTTIIAGNLAFQQSATSSGDIGTETAITWLTNNNNTSLHGLQPANTGYFPTRQDPGTTQTWDNFWTTVLTNQVKTLPTDATTGNTVAYVIQRMCNGTGDPTSPTGPDCNVPQTAGTTSGSSKGAGFVQLLYNAGIYYRITVRIQGPRNTVSYVQTMILL